MLPRNLYPKGVLTAPQVDLMFRINRTLPDYQPYAAAFSLGFYACLHISNVVPAGKWGFDGKRHLTRADITFDSAGAMVFLKWAKNLQRADQFHQVRVPKIDTKPHLCPIRALADILRQEPGLPESPLIVWKARLITEAQVRQRLDKIVTLMGLRSVGLSFHALRSLAVTLAFGTNVPLQHIRAHGAWRSNAIWHYVKQSDRVTRIVPDALQALLQ